MVVDDDTDATNDGVKGLLQWSGKGGHGVAGEGPIGRALLPESRASAAEHGVPGAGPRGRALVHKLDAELGVLSEVVALNGVACSRLWIELHATEQQTGS
jgi:hypothetical protein